jgi:hypothetical protein
MIVGVFVVDTDDVPGLVTDPGQIRHCLVLRSFYAFLMIIRFIPYLTRTAIPSLRNTQLSYHSFPSIPDQDGKIVDDSAEMYLVAIEDGDVFFAHMEDLYSQEGGTYT